MTPVEFQRRMDILSRSSTDPVTFAVAGVVDEALGANAHTYLPAILGYANRLAELKARERKEFGPPTRESIAEKAGSGEGRVPL